VLRSHEEIRDWRERYQRFKNIQEVLVMSMEIERKFVVMEAVRVAEILRFSHLPHNAIEQGYVCITPDREERVRLKMDKHTRCVFVRTVKTSGGLVREEHEDPITAAEYRRLFPLTAGRRVIKTRYELPLLESGLTAEIDVYHGRLAGHVTVEVEASSEEEAANVTLPSWLGEVTEVTENSRYKNQRLAVYGWPEE